VAEGWRPSPTKEHYAKEEAIMLRLSPFITVYCCAVAALLGACTGSFLACLAWRTVHGESVLRGRSHCDVCGHVLGVRDLVPVFSYLLSGGKCRYCGAKLSARHVWGELISAAVFVSLLLQNDISLQTLEGWLLACVLLACAFADLEGYIIPDRFIAAGVVLFAVTLLIEPEPLRRGLDGALGGVSVSAGLRAPPAVGEWAKCEENQWTHLAGTASAWSLGGGR